MGVRFGGVGLRQNNPQNVKLKKDTEREGTFLRHTASSKPVCVTLYLSVWPVQVRKKKGKKAGKTVTTSVYFTYVWSDP